MRKKLKPDFFIICIILIILLPILIRVKSKNSELNDLPSSKAKLSIAVLGDIHGNVDRFKNAVRDLHKINSKVDVLVLNGDTVDQGLDSQYKAMGKSIFRQMDQ